MQLSVPTQLIPCHCVSYLPARSIIAVFEALEKFRLHDIEQLSSCHGGCMGQPEIRDLKWSVNGFGASRLLDHVTEAPKQQRSLETLPASSSPALSTSLVTAGKVDRCGHVDVIEALPESGGTPWTLRPDVAIVEPVLRHASHCSINGTIFL